MSILDDRTELDEAKARLTTTEEQQLVQDLAYWTIRELDHHAEWDEAQKRVVAIATLHAEAQRWSALIGAELRERRATKRAAVES
jgi:hypothetical protein